MSDFEKYWNEHGDVYAMDVAENAWDYQQSKIDELQKENAALVHVIKSRDIQLENEKHEYDELVNKLVDSKMKNTKLQKRVDALKAQLNNMEACYIEKKKQVDELQNRINEALEDLEYPVAPWDETIGLVVKVLRGDE